MASIPLLVTELQSLASETRRKHPDIREAADKSIAILKSTPPLPLLNEPAILQPIFMSLKTKNPKIIAISLSSLQRLISLHAVPHSSIPNILLLMSDTMNMGVDIQLRILQTLVALLTGFNRHFHGQELADALLLCFRLQESKIPVVSSTAAATLRQLVMFVVDKMVDEDHDHTPSLPLHQVPLPDGSTAHLPPSSTDTFHVFQDLCLLANAEKPNFLHLDFLHKTFALELIESVLTNYFQVFREHNELLLLLRHHLCPLLLKSLSPNASSTPFALSLRCTRVVFLLLKQFLPQLKTESEVFLMLLIRLIDNPEPHGADKWMRVLAMEVMRGLCTDATLIRTIYTFYDSNDPRTPILTTLLQTIHHLLLEKPSLLGVNPVLSLSLEPQPHQHPSSSSSSSVLGAIAGAAGSIVGASSSGNGGLSLQGSGMRVQCIDQLDKADPPAIPETYIYLLAVQSLITLCEGIHSFVLPLYRSVVVDSTGVGKAPPAFSFPKDDDDDGDGDGDGDSAQSTSSLWKSQIKTVQSLLRDTFPSIHHSLIYILQTNLADDNHNNNAGGGGGGDLFMGVLGASQVFVNTLGMVGLGKECGLMLCSGGGTGSLGRLAVPERVLVGCLSGGGGSHHHHPHHHPHEGTLGVSTPTAPSSPSSSSFPHNNNNNMVLMGKNAAVLRVVIQCVLFLSGTFDRERWRDVFECVWGADFILTCPSSSSSSSSSSSFPSGDVVNSPSATRRVSSALGKKDTPGVVGGGLGPMEVGQLLGSIQRLFDASVSLDDGVFGEFVCALCELTSSSCSIGGGGDGVGMYVRTVSMYEFALSKMGSVAKLNVDRFIREQQQQQQQEPERGEVVGVVVVVDGWETITEYLLGVIIRSGSDSRSISATAAASTSTSTAPTATTAPPVILPSGIRIQAGRVLDDLMILVPRCLAASFVSDDDDATSGGGNVRLREKVQGNVFNVLGRQVMFVPSTTTSSTYSTSSSATATATGTIAVADPPVNDDHGEEEMREREERSVSIELKRMGLETLLQILQGSGHTLLVGWEMIFEMLGSVCFVPGIPTPPSHTTPSSTSNISHTPTPHTTTTTTQKSQIPLIKTAFQSLTLICDSAVSSLSPRHLELAIASLGKFGKQGDTNIALTAAASLLWSVSDVVMARRKVAASRAGHRGDLEHVGEDGEDDEDDEDEEDEEEKYSRLWMFLLLEVLGLCGDGRVEVRDGAIQTLFRTMQLYGDTLALGIWEDVVWLVVFPLLELLSGRIGSGGGVLEKDNERDGWSDSKILAINSFGSILNAFLVEKIMKLGDFEKVWGRFIVLMEDAIVGDVDLVLVDDNINVLVGGRRKICTPALRCIEKGVKAASMSLGTPPGDGDDNEACKKALGCIWMNVWEAVDRIGSAVLSADKPDDTAKVPFCQDSLVAIVDLIDAVRVLSLKLTRVEWGLDRLTRLMVILKGIITYSHSTDYRPDIDGLTPVQEVALNAVIKINFSVPGIPSVIMRDLAEYATLPFLAAFDVPPPPDSRPSSTVPPKRVTYIGLTKKVMPLLRDLFLKFKGDKDVYVDGTVETVISAYAIPIKLKYECPFPSRFGKDEPLWKTATTCFLKIVSECTPQVARIGSDIPDERLEGIWQQTLDVFKGGILADCSPAENFSLDMQEREENFDLALVSSLEGYVVPYLGVNRVPDMLVAQLAHILARGSRIYDHELSDAEDTYPGTTSIRKPLPRERFSYWCFDLLFVICSDIMDKNNYAKRRLAVLSMPSLLNRCRSTMLSYVADDALRGNLPFPRAREDELIYVLRKLLQLRLVPGSLWAAFSNDPSEHCIEQPDVDRSSSSMSSSELMADSIKRTNVGHLFQFYHLLCKISSIPRKVPASWVLTPPASRATSPTQGLNIRGAGAGAGGRGGRGDRGSAEQVTWDVRLLARDSLKIIGDQMGVPP